MKRPDGRRTVGLALGSGGARGGAHLGVLKALQELQVRVDLVAGTSIGALVGGFFAAGRLVELTEVALHLDWRQALYYFLEVNVPRSGLIDGHRVRDFVRRHVREVRVEQLALPFRAVATDLFSGREVVLDRGDLIEAIRASVSIPGMFTPVCREGFALVDGGLVNPLPVSVVRAMGADVVIAVDLNSDLPGPARRCNGAPRSRPEPKPPAAANPLLARLNETWGRINWAERGPLKNWHEASSLPTIFEVLGQSIQIAGTQITAARLVTDPPDVLVQPKVGRIGYLEFQRSREAYEAGYAAAWSLRKRLVSETAP